jgi:hypothetical protein
LLDEIEGQYFMPSGMSEEGYEYFGMNVLHQGRGYRLVLCFKQGVQELIVLNCYRERRMKL